MRILLPPALSCSFRAICFAMAAVFLHPFNAVAQTQPVAASRTADTFSFNFGTDFFSLCFFCVFVGAGGFGLRFSSIGFSYVGQ